jgi:hypothetical protein
MEEMQTCFKCGVPKVLDEFYKHCKMANGHVGKCKECNKKDVHNNYEEKKVQYTAYYAAREKTTKRKMWRFLKQREYREGNPVQYHCRIITANAIRDGILVKQPCRLCGKIKVEAHHEDYYKPLEVDWLCQKDHRELHEEREFHERAM